MNSFFINVLQKASVGELILVCVCVCAKVLNKARVEKKKNWKKKEWKRALKCCLLKKGSKTLYSALSVAWIFPFVFKSWFCILKWFPSVYFIALLAIALRTFVIPILSLLAITPKPCYNHWLQSWVLCVSICGVWNWYEHMVSLVLASK